MLEDVEDGRVVDGLVDVQNAVWVVFELVEMVLTEVYYVRDVQGQDCEGGEIVDGGDGHEQDVL